MLSARYDRAEEAGKSPGSFAFNVLFTIPEVILPSFVYPPPGLEFHTEIGELNLGRVIDASRRGELGSDVPDELVLYRRFSSAQRFHR